ncbi:MAG: substrate-binding domain-containing protein [Faecalibacterium sp.]
MKKISRRNFLKIAATASAVGALSACGSSSSTASTTSTSSSASENSNFNATGLPVANEKVTYNVLTYQAATSQIPVAEKYVFTALEEDTNVEIVFEEISATAWEQKINLLVSTGQTPDAIIGGEIADIASAIDAELLIPLDDYMDYMPNLKHIYEVYPSAEGATSYLGDGLHYFYPSVGYKTFSSCRAPLFINQDWLDTLGLPMPTTTEEFFDTLVAFRDGDPNGNNSADEIGFSTFDGYFGLMFKDMFGAWDMMGIKNPVETTARDGILDFNPITDNYREAMTFFHELYIEGLLEPEALTLDETTKNVKISTEPAAYGAAQEWSLGTFGNNSSQYTVMDPLIGPSGAQKYTINDNAPVSQAMVVFQGCKDPEILFRYMDHSLDGKFPLYAHYGEEGVLFEVDEDAKTFRVRDTEYTEMGEATETYRPTYGMQNFFSNVGACEYTEVMDPNSPNLAKQEWSDQYAPYMFTEQYPGSTPIPVVTTESKQIALLEEELTVYLEAFCADFILNGTDDAKWETHLQKCEALEYQKVVAYYQDIYDAAYGL